MIKTHFFKWTLVVLFILVLTTLGLGGGFYYRTNQSGQLPQDSLLLIKAGSSVKSTSRMLAAAGVISQPWQFELLSRIKGKNRQMQAGEYVIPAHSSLQEILNIITEGKTYQRRIIIPEGSSMAQVRLIFDQAESIDFSTVTLPPEGYLLPDTYFYTYGTEPDVLISKMRQATERLLDDLWNKRPANFLLGSPDQAIILASIIEEETSVAHERPIIAAVFLNRLKKGMRLQSDPTIIYGITGGLTLGRRLKTADLKRDTPYNSYKNFGLPPTAISNPGIEAIKAVFEPADVGYYYFVADGTGGHVFAKTLSEHQENVRKWRKIRDRASNTNHK